MSTGFDQRRVADARIMVVGCGALGNEVLKNLALLGVGHITLVDFDVVEAGNLSRSVLFSKSDAAAHGLKVEAAAARLRAMNPALEVQTICGDIAYDVGLGTVRRQDVVVGCVDSRWARYCINRLCMRAGVAWVDGGIGELEGTARVFVPGRNCYACNLGPKGLAELARRMPCAGVIRRQVAAGSAPTSVITASVIGAVEAQEALKIVDGERLERGEMTSLCGRMFYYDGQHLTTRTVDFEAWDADCGAHDRWEPIGATAVTADWTVGEALRRIGLELGAKGVTICLENDCFVDYVVDRETDGRTMVMKPGHAVADAIAGEGALGGAAFGGLYQHEYREVDRDFPYQGIGLRGLGIPEGDVLHVVADGKEYYLELDNGLATTNYTN